MTTNTQTPNSTHLQTHCLGYPRIGANRELKKATESYWKGKISRAELLELGKSLRKEHWQKQQQAGINLIPVNDFSFYDQVLDMSCLLGNIPARFGWQEGQTNLDTAFTIARGTTTKQPSSEEEKDCQTGKISTFASEMTKWFDTNYHYIVPEFCKDSTFSLSSSKVFDEFIEACELGIHAKPVLIGPVTYLSLGKVQDTQNPNFNPFSLLETLIPVYEEIIAKLANLGAKWIQLDEPILSTDLTAEQREALQTTYARLAKKKGSAKLLVTTYFGELAENLTTYLALPVDGLHFDLARGNEEIDTILAHFPQDKILSAGVVEGRNIWKNEYETSLSILQKCRDAVGEERLWIGTNCSLLHSPVTLKNEPNLDKELLNWLAFADEKLIEITDLQKLLKKTATPNVLTDNRAAAISRKHSTRIHNAAVQQRIQQVSEADFKRNSSFLERQAKQREKLNLPLLPTTTIGSFPQTKEIRQARAQWKKGTLNNTEYTNFLKQETKKCVQLQDEIGIDMLVHGEFERNDMVEYFGEHLEGFAFTSNGWVQSYGSRYVKPPIIFGDVSRPKPITVYWSKYAQSLTKRPMKGMLTGPVTILQWSFVRDDQPRSTTTQQIALAIRDEVLDLEDAGVSAIQIDEPAFREGLPLRQKNWQHYLKWAVQGFRLSASGVSDTTQIHTHMCYSEFNDIIESIAAMDADVITIETSRSNMELLDAFVEFDYPNEIGPGVYDIHSPRIPAKHEMTNLMQKAKNVLPLENLWINPDCGLKTRQWEEVIPSLQNMVSTAKTLRNQHT